MQNWIDNAICDLEERKSKALETFGRDEDIKILVALKIAREALLKCKHQSELMRVWNGAGWSYPNHSKPIYVAADEAIRQIDELGK